MGSTDLFASPPPKPASWLSAGFRYYSRNFYSRKKFGHAVWKVSLDAGCTCPNRDGSLGAEGCVFCDPESFSPSRRLRLDSISAQLDEGIRRVRARHNVDHFVAYFQPATNTYGALDRLSRLFAEAAAYPGVVGVAIGTRPDCVPDAVLDTLTDLASRTWVTLELGLQTIHDRTLDWLGRGHRADSFFDAVHRCRRRGLEIGVHVILGLPGESREDMLATARAIAGLDVASVKLHNLYAVRNTRLADMVATGEVRLLERDEYVTCAVDFMEALSPDCVIDRLSGDAPREFLIGPQWCLDKAAILAAVEAEFVRRGSWQGCRWEGDFGVAKLDAP